MKFLITGGTGLIGKSIVQLLIEKNHNINVLSRKRGEDTKQVRYYQWSPKNQTIDFTCIDDVDVIINLAGENIFGLWTKSKKKKMLLRPGIWCQSSTLLISFPISRKSY